MRQIASHDAPRRRWLSLTLRLVFTIGLLALVAAHVDFREFSNLLANVGWSWLVLALAVAFADRVIATWRWWLLLRVKGFTIRFLPLLNLHLASNFIGGFLPTSFGVDAVRMVMLARHSGKTVDTIAASAVDRLVMITCTLMVALFVSVIAFRSTVGQDLRWLVLAICAASFGGMTVLIIVCTIRPIASRARFIVGERIASRFTLLYWSIHEFRRSPLTLVTACGISLLLLFVRVVLLMLMAMTFGVNLPFTDYLILWPLASVVMMLPISIGNFGLQEGTYVVLLGSLGVSAASAVSISLLDHALARVVVLPGAIAWMLSSDERRWDTTATDHAIRDMQFDPARPTHE